MDHVDYNVLCKPSVLEEAPREIVLSAPVTGSGLVVGWGVMLQVHLTSAS